MSCGTRESDMTLPRLGRWSSVMNRYLTNAVFAAQRFDSYEVDLDY